jgi:YVTN family beta-propeller protein
MKSSYSNNRVILFLILIVCSHAGSYAQTKGFQVLKTFHIQSAGGWDYLAIGPGNRLYVSHGTQVNVLDKTTGDSIGVIENTTGVHGIAFDLTNGKGYTSNGRLNNVTVFDLTTNKIITQIATGENPDAILYDPFSKMIVTCNGRSKDLSVIDPAANKVVATIAVGGKPETAVTNAAGKLYVNVEDKSEIVEIDMQTFTVLHHWSIAPGEEPSGLAFDKKTNRLFAGCSNKLLMIVDAVTGKIVDKEPIGDGCDGVGFDETSGNIYSSNGEGTLSVIHEKTASKFELVTNIATKAGARTIAVDQFTHLIYLPTAEFEPKEPNTPGRPKMVPGTFQVLVIGQ